MFKTAAILGLLAMPATAQVSFDPDRIDCAVILVFASDPEYLSDIAALALDAVLGGASSAIPMGKAQLIEGVVEMCQEDPSLTLGPAIRRIANE